VLGYPMAVPTTSSGRVPGQHPSHCAPRAQVILDGPQVAQTSLPTRTRLTQADVPRRLVRRRGLQRRRRNPSCCSPPATTPTGAPARAAPSTRATAHAPLDRTRSEAVAAIRRDAGRRRRPRRGAGGRRRTRPSTSTCRRTTGPRFDERSASRSADVHGRRPVSTGIGVPRGGARFNGSQKSSRSERAARR